MKTKRHLFTVVCLTAILATSAATPAAAAGKGWQQEGDTWVYLDTDGSKITSSWAKGSDGQWYYLDDEGHMATETFIETGENTYYVDETGVRVKNRWVSRPNDSLCQQDVNTLWYYFGDDCKAVKNGTGGITLHVGGEDRTYFFDSEGHMLSGWQRLPERTGSDTYYNYYLGAEDEGYAHKTWQYLEPDTDVMTDPGNEYESAEMYYFGWKDRMNTGENEIDGNWYLFDDNGVMLRGWEPGVIIEGGHVGLNKYYDEVTGIRASGWLYAYGVDGRAKDPYWFYLSEKDGIPFNEGAKDSDNRLAFKEINGLTYFFDEQGRMITGLISTGEKGLANSEAIQDKYSNLKGDIGKGKGKKPAGIYYLSLEERNLGSLITDRRINVGTTEEPYYYCFDGSGRAYENALLNNHLYGDNGLMLCSRKNWSLMEVEKDVYLAKDYTRGSLRDPDNAVPVIPAGSQVLVSTSGIVKKEGMIKAGGITYKISNYIAEPKE